MDFAEQNPRAGTLARPYDYFIDTLFCPPGIRRGAIFYVRVRPSLWDQEPL